MDFLLLIAFILIEFVDCLVCGGKCLLHFKPPESAPPEVHIAAIISGTIIWVVFLICATVIICRLINKRKGEKELEERNNTLKQIYESVFRDKNK